MSQLKFCIKQCIKILLRPLFNMLHQTVECEPVVQYEHNIIVRVYRWVKQYTHPAGQAPIQHVHTTC